MPASRCPGALSIGLALTLLACDPGARGAPRPSTRVGSPAPEPALKPVAAPGPPRQRGPAPSARALDAALGPFAIATLRVERGAAADYGGGTVWYPTDTREGPFAAVAVSPGWQGARRSMEWLGPRLASNGFVVIVIDTLQGTDNAEQRAVQLVAALGQLAALSATAGHALAGRVDGNRLGLIGHSYGGGGALVAGRDHPSLKALIVLAPYHESTDFSRLGVPTLVMGCQNDTVAPVATWAIPIYESLPARVSRAYVELAGGDHLCVETGNGDKAVQGRYAVAWMKRYLDDDLRYSPFLCGSVPEADRARGALSAYRGNCLR